ncbi:MAG: hypothetical protein ACLTOU_06200 [Acutalibacter sp.]
MNHVKRSEYVALVNEVMNSETVRIRKTLTNLQESDNKDMLAELLASAILEIPVCAARTAGAIIEKAGLIDFEPEGAE